MVLGTVHKLDTGCLSPGSNVDVKLFETERTISLVSVRQCAHVDKQYH